MQTSSDRILTTHVGSLPRPEAVARGIFALAAGEPLDVAEHRRHVADAVRHAVRRQVEAGIDVVSDGEMSKLSYATYISERLTGFGGDSPRRTPQDLDDFPHVRDHLHRTGGTATYRRPRCIGPIEIADTAPLARDLENLTAAVHEHRPMEAFMNAASPGVIALFQPDDYFNNHASYLAALADAMRPEYETIVAAGFVLQIDSPDLGLGRHTMFKDQTDEEYLRVAEQHVEVLNDALRNIPPEHARIHVCWGNYEGPHTRDIPLARILPIVLRAKPRALLFESANPRHAHEWTEFRSAQISDDKVLVPGVIDSTTHFVEHPELVAQRLRTFESLVGRERLLAGTDCGFSTFAGYSGLDTDVVYAKLASLARGAELASGKPGVGALTKRSAVVDTAATACQDEAERSPKMPP